MEESIKVFNCMNKYNIIVYIVNLLDLVENILLSCLLEYYEGNDLLSRLEKYVCITYICLAIVLGGVAAYFVVMFSQINDQPVVQNNSNNTGNSSHSNNGDNNSNSSSSSDGISNKQEKAVAAVLNHKKYGQVVNLTSSVCIRDEPNVDSNTRDYLYKGMTLDILENNNGWYKIKYKDITGYVNDEYIEEYDETPPNQIYEGIQSNLISENMIPIPIKVELTAYCNCTICSEDWGSQTAMQTHTQIGVVAAPKEIPLGSKINIPELKNYKEDGIFSIEDRGGEVVVKPDGTYIIDVWLPTHDEVKAFGRKKATAFLFTE
jgi:3D (Asp-Asp-Asp) domain-containing protein